MFYVPSIARLFTNWYYYAVWDAEKVVIHLQVAVGQKKQQRSL
jgi:hypothetical protein